MRANYDDWPRPDAELPHWLKCSFAEINDGGANVVLRAAMPHCSKAVTLGFNIDADPFLPCLGKSRSPELHRLKWSSVMSSVKAIATLASVAVIASSAFALSWVGLALLGF
jgi:hypothetical protein